MPHCLLRRLEVPPLPISKDGYSFLGELKGADPFESLIWVSFDQFEFFLQKKHRKKSNDFIIKHVRVAKNLPTGIAKRAIGIFAELSGGEVISHNLNNNSLKQDLISPFSKRAEEFLDFDSPFELEIGFGSGRHLLYRAQNNPSMQFIGVELYTPAIEQVLRQIELKGLGNVWIVHCNAGVFLELLPSSLAQMIYLHFPIPWEKAPHRRVWSQRFLQESLRILSDGGMLELRSDDEGYFWFALELAMKQKYAQCKVNKNIQKEVVSKYEDRWLRKGKDIYDLQVIALPCKKPERRSYDFSFGEGLPKELFEGSSDRMLGKLVGDDWFLHINRLYRNHEVLVLVLGFGDFDQPQSRFLSISRDGEMRYLGGDPIPTLSAFKAHCALLEIVVKGKKVECGD